MDKNIIDWAMRAAGPDDRQAVINARQHNSLEVQWGERGGNPAEIEKTLKTWARLHGWPVSWWNFQGKFLDTMLQDDAHYQLALHETGLILHIPKEKAACPPEALAEMDQEYADHEYRYLVDSLRAIRRALEAGVDIEIAGRTFKSIGSFYNWTHDRWHLLEDDPNTGFILDDTPHPNW